MPDCGRNDAFSSIGCKSHSSFVGQLRRINSLYSKVRSIAAATNGQRGSLTFVVRRGNVVGLVVVVACTGVRVERTYGSTRGILNRHVTTPGAGSHGNPYRAIHLDSGREITDTMLVRVELTSNHCVSICSISCHTCKRAVSIHLQSSSSHTGLFSSEERTIGEICLDVSERYCLRHSQNEQQA